jgi:hypothetical protein
MASGVTAKLLHVDLSSRQMAGWDPSTGRPTLAKLAELGVEETAAGQK